MAWGRWNRPLAVDVCAELGSDVPFFLGDQQRMGIAVATGRGEICELISANPSLEFVVTHPPAGCATREVYQRHVSVDAVRDSKEIIAACEDGQSQKIGAELFNALQFSAARLTPWIEKQLRIFVDAGLVHCQMTGSGSSCFALLERGKIEQGATERMELAARAAGVGRIYYVQAQYSASIEDQL